MRVRSALLGMPLRREAMAKKAGLKKERFADSTRTLNDLL